MSSAVVSTSGKETTVALLKETSRSGAWGTNTMGRGGTQRLRIRGGGTNKGEGARTGGSEQRREGGGASDFAVLKSPLLLLTTKSLSKGQSRSTKVSNNIYYILHM